MHVWPWHVSKGEARKLGECWGSYTCMYLKPAAWQRSWLNQILKPFPSAGVWGVEACSQSVVNTSHWRSNTCKHAWLCRLPRACMCSHVRSLSKFGAMERSSVTLYIGLSTHQYFCSQQCVTYLPHCHYYRRQQVVRVWAAAPQVSYLTQNILLPESQYHIYQTNSQSPYCLYTHC